MFSFLKTWVILDSDTNHLMNLYFLHVLSLLLFSSCLSISESIFEYLCNILKFVLSVWLLFLVFLFKYIFSTIICVTASSEEASSASFLHHFSCFVWDRSLHTDSGKAKDDSLVRMWGLGQFGYMQSEVPEGHKWNSKSQWLWGLDEIWENIWADSLMLTSPL